MSQGTLTSFVGSIIPSFQHWSNHHFMLANFPFFLPFPWGFPLPSRWLWTWQRRAEATASWPSWTRSWRRPMGWPSSAMPICRRVAGWLLGWILLIFKPMGPRLCLIFYPVVRRGLGPNVPGVTRIQQIGPWMCRNLILVGFVLPPGMLFSKDFDWISWWSITRNVWLLPRLNLRLVSWPFTACFLTGLQIIWRVAWLSLSVIFQLSEAMNVWWLLVRVTYSCPFSTPEKMIPKLLRPSVA